jgi:hypothetical protein
MKQKHAEMGGATGMRIVSYALRTASAETGGAIRRRMRPLASMTVALGVVMVGAIGMRTRQCVLKTVQTI